MTFIAFVMTIRAHVYSLLDILDYMVIYTYVLENDETQRKNLRNSLIFDGYIGFFKYRKP